MMQLIYHINCIWLCSCSKDVQGHMTFPFLHFSILYSPISYWCCIAQVWHVFWLKFSCGFSQFVRQLPKKGHGLSLFFSLLHEWYYISFPHVTHGWDEIQHVSNLIKENKLHVIKINQPPEMRVEIFVVMKIMLWSSVQWCGRIPEGHTACIFRVKAAWSYHIIIWCHSPEDPNLKIYLPYIREWMHIIKYTQNKEFKIRIIDLDGIPNLFLMHYWRIKNILTWRKLATHHSSLWLTKI